MRVAEIRRFQPTDRDWLVAAHEVNYAQAEGFDATFGVLVAEIVDEFLATHDPGHEAGFIAWQDDVRLGSIFCVRLTAQTAKLRLFLLSPEARGLGLGRRMLAHCTDFARAVGYADMELWTHAEHEAAGRLYAKNGWVLGESRDVVSFGQPLVEQTWRRSL